MNGNVRQTVAALLCLGLLFSIAAEAQLNPPLETGSPRVEILGVTASGDEGDLRGVLAGAEFVLAERLGVTATPQIGLASAENVDGDDSLITSVDLQLRWYALRVQRLGLFIDAGTGLQYAGNKSFPATGAHINFRLRAGLGARLQLTPRWDVRGGYNWLHMSTANAFTPNVGHDGPMLFLGTSFSLTLPDRPAVPRSHWPRDRRQSLRFAVPATSRRWWVDS
jgi:hypothetical protein